MSESTPGDLYKEGKLAEALAASLAEVKLQPTDTDCRWLLCELLCFAGELERAEKQLETLVRQDPQAMFSITMFRNLLRAETARRRFFREGQPPEILGEKSPVVDLQLAAACAFREGRLSDALQAATSADEQRGRPSGVCDGEAFDDLRDADDLTASVFEILSVSGAYCWLPIDQVESLELGEIKRMTDLLWRSAEVVATSGFAGQVYLPTIYFGTHETNDDQLRLGRGTDWTDDEQAPVRGQGQRIFLVGDQGRPILDMNSIKFEHTTS